MKYKITGKTFHKRQELKRIGAYWENSTKNWYIMNPSFETIDKIWNLGLFPSKTEADWSVFQSKNPNSKTIPLTYDMVYQNKESGCYAGD